jgi:hypothetical protein
MILLALIKRQGLASLPAQSLVVKSLLKPRIPMLSKYWSDRESVDRVIKLWDLLLISLCYSSIYELPDLPPIRGAQGWGVAIAWLACLSWLIESFKYYLWVERWEASCLKGLKYSLLLKWGLPGSYKHGIEVSLAHWSEPLAPLHEASYLGWVGWWEWLEHDDVEWLEGVSWMRWIDCKEDSIAIAVLDKIHREMRSMAIKNK